MDMTGWRVISNTVQRRRPYSTVQYYSSNVQVVYKFCQTDYQKKRFTKNTIDKIFTPPRGSQKKTLLQNTTMILCKNTGPPLQYPGGLKLGVRNFISEQYEYLYARKDRSRWSLLLVFDTHVGTKKEQSSSRNHIHVRR